MRRMPEVPPVGASLLAMDVNDNAGCLNERVVQAFFASKLAPTGGTVNLPRFLNGEGSTRRVIFRTGSTAGTL